jgi:hypothetical protein
MELTQGTLRKTVLCSIIVTVLAVTVEYLPFFTDYEVLENKLSLSYIDQIIGLELSILTTSLLLIIHFVGLILLYLFKPIGRPIYLWSYLLIGLYLMFNGDWIQYSLSHPLETIGSFLEIFILYLIYLTPLKVEFEKDTD